MSADGISLLDEFYLWELRGRGWFVWDDPICLEPPFRPFIRQAGLPASVSDDGRRHTLLSGLIDWLHRRLSAAGGDHPPPIVEIEEPSPQPWKPHGRLVELVLAVPADLDVTPARMSAFLANIAAVQGLLCFELIGTSERIQILIGCSEPSVSVLLSQLQAHFPDAVVTQTADTLSRVWELGGEEKLVIECGLAREFMLPIAIANTFAIDPLLGVIGALAEANGSEVATLQVLFEPARYPWTESIQRSMIFGNGDAFFSEGGRDYLKRSQEKISRPLFATVVRVAARGDDADRVAMLVRSVIGGLSVLGDPEGNELIPLDNEDYEDADHETDLLNRRSRRGGMLLNLDELLGLVHLPSKSVTVPKLRQLLRRSKRAPAIVQGKGNVLGINEHAGERQTVSLSPEQRARHIHVIGSSGTGKSTLLLNLIRQDLHNGDGLMLLDPHGDLIDAVLDLIPPNRVNDVVLVDPGDEDYPVGFNVLSAHSALEKNLLASDLVAVFRRLSTSWGDQMNSVLGNAILAFLERPAGGTLADLRRFLVEPGFRRQILTSVTDPEIVYYWSKEFPLLTGRPQGPVLTRLDAFLRPKPLRNMVAQKESRLDFAQIMDSGKILLARLSHGAIGAENSYLLGTLLLSKVHQLALGRQQQREEERRYFWLYVDEFHNFAIPSMASVLSGIRKYRLGLVLAHQELQQLEHVSEVASSVLSNAFTRVCFRLGDQDARRLESGFSSFEADDLQNLRLGEAICRVERAESDFTLKTQQVENKHERSSREEAIRRSRERYATPRAEVEAVLAEARQAGMAADEQGSRPKPAKKRDTPRQVAIPIPPPDSAPLTVMPPNLPVPIKKPMEEPEVAQTADENPVSPGQLLGRGGADHQELQMQFKKRAERRGWRATIEGEVLGCRAADVALEREGVSVAIEICNTTSFMHELANARKCLDAGFGHVIATSTSGDRLVRLREVVEPQLDEQDLGRMHFLASEEIESFLSSLEVPQSGSESIVCGYRVKTSFKPEGSKNDSARRTVNQVISQSLKRLQARNDLQ